MSAAVQKNFPPMNSSGKLSRLNSVDNVFLVTVPLKKCSAASLSV